MKYNSFNASNNENEKTNIEAQNVPTGPNHFLNKKMNKQCKKSKIGKNVIRFDKKII